MQVARLADCISYKFINAIAKCFHLFIAFDGDGDGYGNSNDDDDDTLDNNTPTIYQAKYVGSQ